MSIDPISPNSVAGNPAHINPQAKADQVAAPAEASRDAQKAAQASKTDTVTISRQAVQKLASDGDTAAQEAKESTAEKATEARKGKA
jgi:hypothetical protein